MTNEERRLTYLEHTRLARPLLCPEISLRLITPSAPLWRATEDEARALGIVDPYWAFCWAGGQAVARHVLDHPLLVSGRRVLDFGSGGGVVAIAAAMRGADVLAADVDPMAALATRENASLNGVSLGTTTEDLVGSVDPSWDVVLVGDVTYEPALAARVLEWLAALARGGVRVLLGDPGRGYLREASLDAVASYRAPADNDPDDSLVVETTVYSIESPPGVGMPPSAQRQQSSAQAQLKSSGN